MPIRRVNILHRQNKSNVGPTPQWRSSIRMTLIHRVEQAIERGNLRAQFLVAGALKFECQLVHASRSEREFLRWYELDRHRR